MKLPFVDQVGIEPADVVWDLAHDARDNAAILAQVNATEERRNMLALLRGHVPVAKTCKAFVAPPYCRPTIHRRTIYFQLEDGGVLGIKGTEPHAEDLSEEILHLESLRASFFPSFLNELALGEHRVPMGLTLAEAMTEAETTLSFHRKYNEWFGRVARVPVHVLVYRWRPEIGARLLAALAPSLCAPALRSTRWLGEEGRGAVVYYYPSLPLRASRQARDRVALLSQISDTTVRFSVGLHERAGVSFASRVDALSERTAPWSVVQSWIALLADILLMGYFPLDTYAMGHCVQAQNLCIDGGLADTDSLRRMSEISDQQFYEIFLQTIGELIKACTIYLTGTATGRYTDQIIGSTLWYVLYD